MSAVPYLRGQPERVALRPIQLRAQLHLVSPDAVVAWIHCARVGRWEGHPQGTFEFTIADLQRACENFYAQTNAIPLTYDHPDADGKQPIEKAGWVHDLRLRGDQLYALCEFTDEAVRLNRAGSYKFCSISFVPDGTDRVSGERIGMEINEIGMTDSPYIDSLDPIRLSRNATGGNMKAKKVAAGSVALGIDVKAIVAAIGQMEGDVTGDRIKVLVDAEIARQEAISGDGDAPPLAEPAADLSATPSAMALAAAPAASPEQMAACLDACKACADTCTSCTESCKTCADACAPIGTDNAKACIEACNACLAACDACLKTCETMVSDMSASGAAPESQAKNAPGHGGPDPMAGMARELGLVTKQLSVLIAERDAAKRKTDEVTALSRVEAMIKRGCRMSDAERKEWLALAVEAPERFTRLAATLAPEVPTEMLTGAGSGQRPQGVTAPGRDDKQTRQLRQALSGAGFAKAKQDEMIKAALAQIGAGDAE